MIGTGVSQPENHDAWKTSPSSSQNLAKIEIEGEHDAILGSRFVKDRLVRRTMKALLAQVEATEPPSSTRTCRTETSS